MAGRIVTLLPEICAVQNCPNMVGEGEMYGIYRDDPSQRHIVLCAPCAEDIARLVETKELF